MGVPTVSSVFVSNLWIAFEQVVERQSNDIAIEYPSSGGGISYADLRKRALLYATALHDAGVRRGDVVAIFHDKSFDAYALMLACLRLGAAYSNLDPTAPATRIRRMLDTCEPRLIIQCDELADSQCTTVDPYRYVALSALRESVKDDHDALPHPAEIAGNTVAYIMFTSGSTGVPKGVAISHANLLWYTHWIRSRFALGPGERMTNLNPMYFDNSVFDFYGAIFSGATLLPFSSEQVRSSRDLVRLVDASRCTVWFSVPSLLVFLLVTRAVAPESFRNLRSIIFGGEGFPKPRLKELWDIVGSRTRLENVYGPTECTCMCSAHTIVETDFTDMQSLATLGPIAQNFEAIIEPLDPSDSSYGELLLAGPQVGLGYYRDPERTAASFVQNPINDRCIDIVYRTGDIVSMDLKGALHFKGRKDRQIKHMGYRIELEEIEAAMASIEGIRECAVVYVRNTRGMGEIHGFATVSNGLAAADVREALRDILPHYMVPHVVQIVSMLPKNNNGKVDRLALQELHLGLETHTS